MRLVKGRAPVAISVVAVAVVAMAALPAVAAGQDRRLSSTPTADLVDALQGSVMWTLTLPQGDVRRLVLLRPGAQSPYVTGVSLRPVADPNLGLDGRGRVVVSYAECVPGGGCRPAVYDVAAGRARFLRTRVPRGCRLHDVAVWRARTALALWCGTGRVAPWANRVLIDHRGKVRLLPVDGVDAIELRDDVLAGYSREFQGSIRLLAHGRAACRTTVDRGSESPAGSYSVSSLRMGASGLTWLADSRFAERHVYLRSASIGDRCAVRTVVSPSWGPDLLAGSGLSPDRSFTSAVRDGSAIYYTVRGAGVFRRERT